MEVGYGKNAYKAISEASVLNGVKPLLKKHKLILFPVKAEITERVDSYPGNDGEKARLMSQVKAQYKIVDIESKEFELLETVGNGADPQDKGSGKAWTYAYKALLQKTFMLFSGEDTDNEHSDDIGNAPQGQKQGNKGNKSSCKGKNQPDTETGSKKPTTEQLKALMILATKKDVSLKVRGQEWTGKQSSSDWDMTDYMKVKTELEKLEDKK